MLFVIVGTVVVTLTAAVVMLGLRGIGLGSLAISNDCCGVVRAIGCFKFTPESIMIRFKTAEDIRAIPNKYLDNSSNEELNFCRLTKNGDSHDLENWHHQLQGSY